MIHVWITQNPCGPFAALEGVGAGQVLPGQTRAATTCTVPTAAASEPSRTKKILACLTHSGCG